MIMICDIIAAITPLVCIICCFKWRYFGGTHDQPGT